MRGCVLRRRKHKHDTNMITETALVCCSWNKGGQAMAGIVACTSAKVRVMSIGYVMAGFTIGASVGDVPMTTHRCEIYDDNASMRNRWVDRFVCMRISHECGTIAVSAICEKASASRFTRCCSINWAMRRTVFVTCRSRMHAQHWSGCQSFGDAHIGCKTVMRDVTPLSPAWWPRV